ncbi:MAG: carbohydrate kinase family protein [Desulfobacteraceae bacterium]|nr:carbohydrate kinase family protein [Desulfobacteraceae bacterium]
MGQSHTDIGHKDQPYLGSAPSLFSNPSSTSHPDIKLDVIGIGAINVDFISHDGQNKSGREIFVDYNHLTNILEDYMKNGQICNTRIGGSAYLAIKTISHLGLNLKTGYVGVVGTIDEFIQNAEHDEFAHLSSQEWLFSDNDKAGKALVTLCNGERDTIQIAPGANDKLVKRIIEKDDEEGTAFVKYLASARWIHITSLKIFADFKHIISKIEAAKDENPFLKVSIDPGFDYTFAHKQELLKLLKVADFLFFTEKEFDNLLGGPKHKLRAKITKLKKHVKKNTLVLVHRKKNNMVIHFLDNNKIPLVNTYYHKKFLSPRINDDTGADDVLAGGVIGGLLTPQMFSYQPAPINLGTELANLVKSSSDFPYDKFASEVRNFFENGSRSNKINWYQKWCHKIKILQVISSFAIGFFSSFAIGFFSSFAIGFFSSFAASVAFSYFK